MRIHVVEPHGFCSGVNRALLLAEKAKGENPNKGIYLLGMIVHNENVILSLEKEGFHILDERKSSLSILLESIPEGEVVVFSAHGHDAKLDEIAKKKGLLIYDATCPFVNANVKEANESKEEIIYIGVKGHLESEAFLANCPTSSFYDVRSGQFLDKVKGEHPLVVAQTTLGDEEYEKALETIKAAHPLLTCGKQRCPSTKERQNAIRDIPSSIEEVIILGSKTSNNSKKLFEIAQSKGHKAYLCLGLEEVKKLKLNGSQVALSSGASTAPSDFKAVLSYLESI